LKTLYSPVFAYIFILGMATVAAASGSMGCVFSVTNNGWKIWLVFGILMILLGVQRLLFEHHMTWVDKSFSWFQILMGLLFLVLLWFEHVKLRKKSDKKDNEFE
jgi:hypothetical protein